MTPSGDNLRTTSRPTRVLYFSHTHTYLTNKIKFPSFDSQFLNIKNKQRIKEEDESRTFERYRKREWKTKNE